MELSEAIRAGAKLRPQGFGDFRTTYRRWPWSPPEVRTCALGAAYEAVGHETIGGHPVLEHRVLVPEDWRRLLSGRVACPQCGAQGVVFSVVTHLNDTHRWTREHTAAWVRHLERK